MATPVDWIMGAIYVISFVVAWSMAKSDEPGEELTESTQDPGVLTNTRSTSETIPIVYGEGRIGGNQVFMTTTGDDNKYMHVILTLGEGYIDSIKQVSGVDQIFLDGELYTTSDYKDNFFYSFFGGSSTQNVCTTLNTAYGYWTDPLRYTSYLYCRFEYDRDKFSAIPEVTVIVKGIQVKNFETIDDYDLMPKFYTNNLAYCIYDFMTRSSVRGGKGIDPERIDLPSFREAATYYDTYGWTCNMVINKDQAVEDNLATLLVNGRSSIIYSNYTSSADNKLKFKLKFRDTRIESACMEISKNDIIQSGKESSLEISSGTSLFSKPNSIKASFYNAEKNYTKDEKVFTDEDALAAEGDKRELTVSLLGLSTLDKVIQMSYYYLERARLGNSMKMIMGNKGLSLEPMDLVTITSVMPGWNEESEPLYRVETAVLQDQGNVALSLIQEFDDLYDDDYDIGTQELFITDLPKPGGQVYGVILGDPYHEQETYNYRNKSFTRWKIFFDPPSVSDYPFWDHAEIWVKIGDGDYIYMTTSTSDYMIDPVEEGETYTVKIRSVSIHGVKEDFNSCIGVCRLITDETGRPADMSYLTISSVNDAIFIYGDEVEGPDITGYEFRICAQTISDWGGAVYLGFNKKPNWSLSGIRAGSYRIFCSPMTDSIENNYSVNPIYADFTVQDPKGYTVYLEHDFDNPVGSHYNTEWYNDTGDYDIRVVHSITPSILEGTWTSPIVDVGEVRHLRVQGDFVLQVIDSSKTWSGLWPNPNIWTRYNVTNKSWSELIGLEAASKIEAKLKWGKTPALGNSIDKFELMSVDTEARYYQVEVKLIDPDNDQYVLLDGIHILDDGYNGPTALTLQFMR